MRQKLEATGSSPAPVPPVVASSAPPLPAPPAPVATAAPPAATGDEADNDTWSQSQQQQLEAGLRKYPATLDKAERWAKIAAEVTGKSKKACVARFKALREEIAAKKAATAKG